MNHSTNRDEVVDINDDTTSKTPHIAVASVSASSSQDAAPDGGTVLQTKPSPAATTQDVVIERAGRYEIGAEIGSGGMGVVLRARDPELRRILAVKVLLECHRGDAGLERRFREEAQITGQLQHPGVPPVHEIGVLPDGRPFFAMKLIKGRTLAELLQERPTPTTDLPRFLAIFEQVCQTLAYAHSKDVIHRDLKPANVMVGAFNEVQVMDWGLAKVRGDEHPPVEEKEASIIATVRSDCRGLQSQAGSVMGTPAYMAPEQARGEIDQLDERCDVFGLGAILCVILTNQPPYVGPTTRAVRGLAEAGDLGSTLARLDVCGADSELVALARACLEARKEDRLPNAQAVADAVTAYQDGVREKLRQAELARAATALRIVEERKRRRLWRLLTAVGLAAVVGAGLGWRWIEQMNSAYRARTAMQVNQELDRAAALRDQAARFVLMDADGRRQSARTWQDARDAAQKAEDLLATAAATPEVRRRVEALVPPLRAEADDAARDRAMVQRLEAAHELRGQLTDEDCDQANPKGVIVYSRAGAKAYADAFRAYGIDVLTLEPSETAQRIREHPHIRVRLTDALDDWLALEQDQPAAQRLLTVCREADPDPFRNRLRAAVAAGDEAALKALAGEAAKMELSVPTALLLADGLQAQGDLNAAIELLQRVRQRRVRQRRPDDFWIDDFWIDDILGVYLSGASPPRTDEAERCFAAALALHPDCFFAWDNLGGVLTWQGRYAEAIQAYEKAFQLYSTFYKTKLDLSQALDLQGDVDKALATAEEVVRADPQFAGARYFLASYQMEKGEKEAALQSAHEFLRMEPKNPLAYWTLGNVLLGNAQPKEAATAYRRALELNPRLVTAQIGLAQVRAAQKQPEEAVKMLQEILVRDPDRYDVQVALSMVRAQQGNWADAVAVDRRAVALRPAFWQGYVILGNHLQSAGAPREALTAYQEAVRLNPRSVLAHNGIGNALGATGASGAAIAEYTEATHLQPDLAVLHNNLGRALFKNGQPKQALVELHKAVDMEPNNPVLQASLHDAEGENFMAKTDFAAAAQAFRQATALQDDNVLYWQHLANAYRQGKKYAQAVGADRQQVRLNPKDGYTRLYLGWDLRFTKAYAEAVQVDQESLRLKPDYARGYSELGQALQASGAVDESLTAYQQGLFLSPDDAVINDNLGQNLAYLGRWREALTAYQRATQHSQKPFARAFGHMGVALRLLGRFAEARAAFEKASALGQAEGAKAGAYQKDIQQCDHLLELARQQDDVLAGKLQPAPAEAIDFALFCTYTGHPAQSLPYFTHMLEDPSISKRAGVRFPAALAAVKAAAEADGDKAAALRRQALDWLKADLENYKKLPADKASGVYYQLNRWRHHIGLSGLRDPQALANLPSTERGEWVALWAEVDALLKGDGMAK